MTRDLVDIWWVRLDIPPDSVRQATLLLSEDERERANAFHFDRDRRRYIAGRAGLRRLLGKYLAVDAARLEFAYGPKGKPYLAGPLHVSGRLCFNVSNSDELAVIAVSLDRELGVDLEAQHPLEYIDQIATRYFCEPERDNLVKVNGEHKRSLFYTYWTRKEALLKATGTGLSAPLTSIDVSQLSSPHRQQYVLADGSGAIRRFALMDLDPEKRYLGAIAAEGSGWRIRCQGFVDDECLSVAVSG